MKNIFLKKYCAPLFSFTETEKLNFFCGFRKGFLYYGKGKQKKKGIKRNTPELG